MEERLTPQLLEWCFGSSHTSFELAVSRWLALEHLDMSSRRAVAYGSASLAEEESDTEARSGRPSRARRPYSEAATCLEERVERERRMV
jgi:hypothetical protein